MANELMHYGIKGQKWGVRRFQNKDGSRTALGKKRYASNDNSKPQVTKNKYNWGEITRISYTNSKNTAEKAKLDKLAEEEDRWSVDEFDREFTRYANDFREKGEEYANKMIHERLKNYSYEFDVQKEVDYGEEYTTYALKVIGNKSYYHTFGEENYADEQYFGKNKE